MKHKILIFSCLMCVVCNSCSDKAEHRQTQKISQVETETVVQKPINEELMLNGRVVCDESLVSKVFLPCSGRVSAVLVSTGDRVKKGQTIAVIDSREAAQFQAEIAAVESQLRVAQRTLNADQGLFDGGLLSEKELAASRENVQQLTDTRNSMLALSRINGFGQGAAVNITSPIDGYVTARNVFANCQATADDDEPAFEIAGNQNVWVIADVYENDIAKIRQNEQVSISTLAYKGEIFSGKIDRIYNSIDNESKTMKVRISLPNPDQKLVPGIFATVSVRISDGDNSALAVPSESVVFEGGCHYVITSESDKYVCQKVNVVKDDGLTAWVDGNLRQGQKVVSKNALLIFNGNK